MATTFPLIAAGWRAAVGWYGESTYGTAPTSVQYKWVGAVQSMKGTIDKQPIFVYRMDGSTDFPAYLLKGIRNVDFTITYWPQDIAIMVDQINQLGLSTVSHSFIIKDFDTGNTYTVTGAIANTVRISGRTGQALEVEVTYWCQNILWGSGNAGLPSGATFSSDPGNVPFFFSQESVQIPSATPKPQTLTFTATITNNLQRVPQFNTDVIRSIPTLTRKADGTITATFAAMNDVANESNVPYEFTAGTTPYVDTETAPSGLSQQTIRVVLGVNGVTTYYLDYTGAVLPKIDLTIPIADLVALELPWTATGATVHT
jgi:hypothetical protein